MIIIISLIIFLLVFNSSLILFLIFHNKKPNQTDLDIELLSDLSQRNRSLIEIKRISPESFFIRNPRA